MLKKRFIGVLTILDGWVVQSFGFNKYLPIGHPKIVVENLDRWGVDEILILSIDRSSKGLGPDIELLREIGTLPLSTPLTYGGGISNVEQASSVVELGAERICVDTLLHSNKRALSEISQHLGSQAIIGSLPLNIESGKVLWYHHTKKIQISADKRLNRIFEDGLVSEALVIDWQNEGTHNGFNLDLIRKFPILEIPIIAFGGLSEIHKIVEVLNISRVRAVAVGNFLNYKEHSVQKFKESMGSPLLRKQEYSKRQYS